MKSRTGSENANANANANKQLVVKFPGFTESSLKDTVAYVGISVGSGLVSSNPKAPDEAANLTGLFERLVSLKSNAVPEEIVLWVGCLLQRHNFDRYLDLAKKDNLEKKENKKSENINAHVVLSDAGIVQAIKSLTSEKILQDFPADKEIDIETAAKLLAIMFAPSAIEAGNRYEEMATPIILKMNEIRSASGLKPIKIKRWEQALNEVRAIKVVDKDGAKEKENKNEKNKAERNKYDETLELAHQRYKLDSEFKKTVDEFIKRALKNKHYVEAGERLKTIVTDDSFFSDVTDPKLKKFIAAIKNLDFAAVGYACSVNYVLEEFAYLRCLTKKTYLFYPNKVLDAMTKETNVTVQQVTFDYKHQPTKQKNKKITTASMSNASDKSRNPSESLSESSSDREEPIVLESKGDGTKASQSKVDKRKLNIEPGKPKQLTVEVDNHPNSPIIQTTVPLSSCRSDSVSSQDEIEEEQNSSFMPRRVEVGQFTNSTAQISTFLNRPQATESSAASTQQFSFAQVQMTHLAGAPTIQHPGGQDGVTVQHLYSVVLWQQKQVDKLTAMVSSLIPPQPRIVNKVKKVKKKGVSFAQASSFFSEKPFLSSSSSSSSSILAEGQKPPLTPTSETLIFEFHENVMTINRYAETNPVPNAAIARSIKEVAQNVKDDDKNHFKHGATARASK